MKTNPGVGTIIVLVAVTLMAGGAFAQADNPINEPNIATVTVNEGQTVRSSNATAAITLRGGAINNSGTVINTATGQRAILTSEGTTITNFASGTISGLIQMQGTGAVANVIVNDGTITGTNGEAISTPGGKDDTIFLNAGSETTGNIRMSGGAAPLEILPQINIADNDTLNFVGDGGRLDGSVFGAETINKIGAGTFTFNGNATGPLSLNVSGGTLSYVGETAAVTIDEANTTISGGSTLSVGANATLRSSAMNVTGAGSNLAVGNGGTVVANGNTSFGTGTSFAVAQGGQFTVANLAMTGATGQVAGRANVTDSLTMTDSVINVAATGDFEAAGTSTFTNSLITVDAGGALDADVSYQNTAITVNGTQEGNIDLNGGSVLKGSGTITGNVVVRGSRIAPGNSPGTINIGGNLTLDGASTTEIEISNAASDLINVGGVANLAGTLQIVPLDSIRAARTITVITAAGGFTGAFANTVTNSTPVITFTTRQNANTFDILVGRNAYEPFALSVNQRGPANFLDRYLTTTLTQLDTLTLALDRQTSQAGLVAAFEQLHAEPYDAHAQITLQDQQQFAGQMESYLMTARLNRNRPQTVVTSQATGGPLSMLAGASLSASMLPDAGVRNTGSFLNSDEKWGSFGYYYDYEGENQTRLDLNAQIERTGFDYGHRGAVGGVDRHVGENAIVGLTFGAGEIHGDFAGARGRIDADTWDLGAYGTWAGKDGKYVDALVNYTNYEFSTLRSVNFTGFSEVNRARHDADALSGYIGAGWLHDSGDWQWGPTASLQYTNSDLDPIVETGGVSSLTINAREVESLRSQLGIRARRQYKIHSDYTLTPEFRLRWAHEFSNDDRALTASFTSVTGSGLAPFTSFAQRADRDSAYLGMGTNVFFKKSVSGFVNYDYDLGRKNSRVDAGRFGLAVKF